MTDTQKYEFGLVGLAVMGQNLARNVAHKGFSIAVYNRTSQKTDEFLAKYGHEGTIGGAHTPEELVNKLAKPRKIMFLVKAGKPVDDMIEAFLPYLEPGDILIDGGNSHFTDTRRRAAYLKEKGFRFLGVGVSGGEEGALKGPSLMPGGSEEAYKEVAPIFTAVAAQVADGPCCSYVGNDGAGHYVKMVHNGIEYGDMQLISEAYFMMKELLHMSDAEMGEVFTEWNKGILDSYLIEITSKILKVTDRETGIPLVEEILDKAGQKGTGKWTSQDALDLGVPIPTIAEAVFARGMSAYKGERVEAAKELKGPDTTFTGDKKAFVDAIHSALYASKICSYAQGFALIKAAAKEYDWNINFGDMALLWRGGCIIRAVFLEDIKKAFQRNPELPNLLLDPFFRQAIEEHQAKWREAIIEAKRHGIPTPAFSASLDYYDSYRRGVLPANLIQAQRDFFGAHTYERVDKEGIFHTEWEQA